MDLDLGVLDSLGDDDIMQILQNWEGFCACTNALLAGNGDLSVGSDLVPFVESLCRHNLASLMGGHFLYAVEKDFKKNAVRKFWHWFDGYSDGVMDKHRLHENCYGEVLSKSLEEICLEKSHQEKSLLIFIHSLEIYAEKKPSRNEKCDSYGSNLLSQYQLMISSVLLATLPWHFSEILRHYFRKQLEEFGKLMSTEYSEGTTHLINKYSSQMDVDGSCNKAAVSKNCTLIKNIGKVVHDLRVLGFTAMAEEAYASAIFLLLKAKVHDLAGNDYHSPVLESIKGWIQVVPLQFLGALLSYLGDTTECDAASSGLKSPLASQPSWLTHFYMPSEGLIRWQLRLEYSAYETLQDLRIGKLFDIIVDYPDSSPAIDDLRKCLDYTGQHSKLIDSFVSSLRYRLLTAGAATNDILHQYVSTIKALRTVDPTGVFLEAVGEPIKDYLRGRKDTVKCIVTMLTDGSGGNSSGTGSSGDSLLEELNRDAENQEGADYDDDCNVDDKKAWINAERWEPDPVEVGPSSSGRNRRKVHILGMIVGIIGSKDQLVNEYRVMLAEKLLSKSDYDIDSEIRTLELLKIHFGESSMQKCEIMLNDLIDSKRTNANIKASLRQSQTDVGIECMDNFLSLDLLDAVIISSNFWPPIQAESLKLPSSMDQLLSDYATRFHEIKAPRKLLWMKNLGTIKLELEFEGRSMEFAVAPVYATIIMKFQDQASWTSKHLADSIGISVESLNRRISFWISKGIIAELEGEDSDDHTYVLVVETSEMNQSGVGSGSCEDLLAIDDDRETLVASVEEQWQKEMTVYEKFIIGMLTNFGSMGLDRIHNTLKMFCIADPTYDKSLQQLQSFLSALVSEEKLEIRDGLYFLKK